MKKHKDTTDHLQKILEKIENQDGHWVWQGAINSNGCAVYRASSGLVTVQRYLWDNMACKPPLKKGQRIKCSCGVKGCVNPSHWELWHFSNSANESSYLRSVGELPQIPRCPICGVKLVKQKYREAGKCRVCLKLNIGELLK